MYYCIYIILTYLRSSIKCSRFFNLKFIEIKLNKFQMFKRLLITRQETKDYENVIISYFYFSFIKNDHTNI